MPLRNTMRRNQRKFNAQRDIRGGIETARSAGNLDLANQIQTLKDQGNTTEAARLGVESIRTVNPSYRTGSLFSLSDINPADPLGVTNTLAGDQIANKFKMSVTDPLGNIEEGLESAKMEHTLGGFLERETGSKGLASVFDPAYQDVEKNVDPALFGNAATGKEGLFDDPLFTGLLNFVPFGSAISAGGNILNRQADYANLKEAGYNPTYGRTVVNPAATTAASYYINTAGDGDPYGYGTSVGGKAGTAATTAGIGSAIQGQTLEQQLRNAAIAGGSTYAGGSLAEATGSPSAGKFGSMATSMGLRELWEDPEAVDAAEYYNNLINQYQANREGYDQPMVDIADFQNIQSLSPDSPLLAMFQQQDQDMPQKRGRVGGSGQFSAESDQIEQSSGSDTYLI